jgi:hypothetical protein
MEEIVQKYQKSINSLLEEDRGIKRKGLEDLKSLFKEMESNLLLV